MIKGNCKVWIVIVNQSQHKQSIQKLTHVIYILKKGIEFNESLTY